MRSREMEALWEKLNVDLTRLEEKREEAMRVNFTKAFPDCALCGKVIDGSEFLWDTISICRYVRLWCHGEEEVWELPSNYDGNVLAMRLYEHEFPRHRVVAESERNRGFMEELERV